MNLSVCNSSTKRHLFASYSFKSLARGLFILFLIFLFHASGSVTETTPIEHKRPLLRGAAPYSLGSRENKTAVLLIHGFLGAGQNFDDLPERLAAAGFFVRVMLLPGHGTTPEDLAKIDSATLKQAVIEEVVTLKTQNMRVFLIGHSMGGTLAVLAATHQDVNGIVLAAPFFKVTRKPYYLLPPETWFNFSKHFLTWIYKGRRFVQVNRPEAKDKILSYRWVPTSAISTLFDLGKEAAASYVVSSITCPCLIIHSTGDEAASYDAAREFFNKLRVPDKQFVELHRSNHHLFFDYDAPQVNDTILEWLAKTCRKGESLP